MDRAAELLIAGLITIAALAVWLLPESRLRRKWHRWRTGQCPACAYDLRMHTDRCPECGRPVQWKD